MRSERPSMRDDAPGVRRREFLTSVAALSAGCMAASVTCANVAAAADEATPAQPFSRHEAASIIANARRIVTPNGIERLEAVRIGGIEQWVSVRGADKRNPVLLFLHGGPGYVSIPMSWWFTRGWEEYFTVVQWDQRGAGKTFLLNGRATLAPTMTPERMVADAQEMVSWVARRLGKEKIFVLGHSWGSYLGLELAKREPHALHAYIGVGQLTNAPESERRGWQFAVAGAHKEGNAKAVRELETIAPYFPPGHPSPLKDLYVQRRWLEYYGGSMAYRHGSAAEGDLSELSPDYTDAEIAHIWDGNDFSEHYLLQHVLSLDESATRQLECPLIVCAGRHDFVVNSELAAQWLTDVRAPLKQLVWFENAGHLVMTDEPGKFLVSLLRHARPIAECAGDPPQPA
jgi:pimeloyl-ACP methyl ester carboxylesterase